MDLALKSYVLIVKVCIAPLFFFAVSFCSLLYLIYMMCKRQVLCRTKLRILFRFYLLLYDRFRFPDIGGHRDILLT